MEKWILKTRTRNIPEMSKLLDARGIKYHFQDMGNDCVRLCVPYSQVEKAKDVLSGQFLPVNFTSKYEA